MNTIETTHTITLTGSDFAELDTLARAAGLDLAKLAITPPTPTPENPLCLGAVEPRLSRSQQALLTGQAQQMRDNLNDLAQYLESHIMMSADQRNAINRGRSILFSNLNALDGALYAANATVCKLRKQLEETTRPTQPQGTKISLPYPGFLTNEARDVWNALADLAAALDFCTELEEENRATINDHLEECASELDNLDNTLDDARSDASWSETNAATAEEELETAENRAASLAEHIDRHPHLLDDLLDYTAHLRHTGADRKDISLLELTCATLKTIQTLIN